MNELELARLIAAKFHAGQKYGDDDYMVHLDEVESMVVVMFPGEERLRVVAQLHNILEDTQIGENTLLTLFDQDIVDAVVWMTKDSTQSRPEYLEHCKTNQLARKCKLADAFCNLRRSLIRGDMKRVKRYGETLAVLAT